MTVIRHRRPADIYGRFAGFLALAGTALVLLLPYGLAT